MKPAMPPRAGRAGTHAFAGKTRISAVSLAKLPVDLYITLALMYRFAAVMYVPVTAMYMILAAMCIPITAMYSIAAEMYR